MEIMGNMENIETMEIVENIEILEFKNQNSKKQNSKFHVFPI